MRLPGMFTALLQMTIDAALDRNDEALLLCKRLNGKVMALEFTELGATLWMRPREGGIDLLNQWTGGADVTIRGNVPGLLAANLMERRTGIRIDGDAETGQEFQQLLALLDIDWEEKLSRFLGDTAAHRLASTFRGLRQWGRDSAERFGDNLREYLQEETEDLPRRREVDEFLGKVDTLRMDVDRVDARLQRLFRKAAQAGINLTGGDAGMNKG